MKISNAWIYARGELELNCKKRYQCSQNHSYVINVRCFSDKAIWNLSQIHLQNCCLFELIYSVVIFSIFGIWRNCVYAKDLEYICMHRGASLIKMLLFIETLFNYLAVFVALLSIIIMFYWNLINNCVYFTVNIS